jgi:anti-sigma factor RsiW
MAGDQELTARVEQWRRQNEAIRKIFGENWIGREAQSRADFDAPLRSEPSSATPLRRVAKRQTDSREHKSVRGLPASAGQPKQAEPRPVKAGGGRLGRSLALLFAGLVALAMSVTPAPFDRSALLTSAAFSAYRTFANGRTMEFAGAEPAALERWLRSQLGGFVAIPNFAPAGFALVGGRVTAGAQGPAAFALYQNSVGERVGLSLERGESTSSSKPFVRTSDDLTAVALAGSGSTDATLVGKAGTADLLWLARLARPSLAATIQCSDLIRLKSLGTIGQDNGPCTP